MTTLNAKLLLDKPFAHVIIREDRILSITFRGFLKPEQADLVSSAIFRAVSELKLELILINQKELKVLSKEIQNQFTSNILKITPFISRAAIIEPEDIFAAAGLKTIQKNDHSNKGKNFTNEHEAIEWLLKRNQ